MNLKFEITRQVLAILEPNADDRIFQRSLNTWWFSTRKKEQGGLRLTDFGYKCFLQADIKPHRVRFEKEVFFTNQLIIWLDNFIDCPFYLEQKEIIVFSENMAIQLVLFSGDIYRYSQIKAENTKKS